jgi:hypothetical protein
LNVAPILRDIIRTLILFSGALTCCAGARAGPVQYTPVKWERFVKVEGQPLPVPERWQPDEEARIAHSLKLPDAVPKPVPFDFDKARRMFERDVQQKSILRIPLFKGARQQLSDWIEA